MAITHTNVRGETYYLHSRLTKKGNTTYYFAKKSEGTGVRNIPKGFEIYEEPNGMVYLRKVPSKLIRDEEIKTIQTAMEKFCSIQDFKLNIKKKFVYIYILSTPRTDLNHFLNGITDEYKDYEAVMRFHLIDEQTSLYEVERFCFLGSIEDWIYIDSSDDLEQLAKEYVRHIGQESFYELI